MGAKHDSIGINHVIGDANRSPRPVLEPVERLSRVLFGLIMVLTFTGSLSIAEKGHADIDTMLVGAIGCNIAWGLIDAIMYLMASLSERGQNFRMRRAVARSADDGEARRAIAAALPRVVASVLGPEDFDRIRGGLSKLPEPPDQPTLRWKDLKGASGVFLLVFLSTFPVILPFLFLHDPLLALRLSNAIAIVMLFALGYAFGKLVGYSPWVSGGSMVVLGIALVAITIAMGG